MEKNKILLSSGDNSLSGIYWQAENPIAISLIVHGFGEHISRYDHVAQQFINKNISVLGVDLVGHGNSTGKRGVIRSINDFFGCIDSMLNYVAQERSSLPRILYGYSMGGNIVLNYLIKSGGNNFCCALATSHWLKLAVQPGAIQLFLARTMNNIYPSLQQSADLDVKKYQVSLRYRMIMLKTPLIMTSYR